jgi:hypothetical protein
VNIRIDCSPMKEILFEVYVQFALTTPCMQFIFESVEVVAQVEVNNGNFIPFAEQVRWHIISPISADLYLKPGRTPASSVGPNAQKFSFKVVFFNPHDVSLRVVKEVLVAQPGIISCGSEGSTNSHEFTSGRYLFSPASCTPRLAFVRGQILLALADY